MNLREVEISPVVHAFLKARGCKCYAEVYHCGSFIDWVGLRGKEVTVVEMKDYGRASVFEQAAKSSAVAHYTYIAVLSKPTETTIERCIAGQYGLLHCDEPEAKVIVEAVRRVPQGDINFLSRLSRCKEDGVAGLPRMETEIQKLHKRVEQYRKDFRASEGRAATWFDIFADVPNDFKTRGDMIRALKPLAKHSRHRKGEGVGI